MARSIDGKPDSVSLLLSCVAAWEHQSIPDLPLPEPDDAMAKHKGEEGSSPCAAAYTV